MITFERVSKSYPEFAMHIDFSIHDGELVSILGPSGSGKTTTLRLIAGFEHPDGGRILINDRDVTTKTPAERQIGYVFQDYTLFPHMTVAENVGYGLRVRHRPPGEIRAKVGELLELMDLPGYEDRDVSTLSGGERQRVAIARALAVDPVLLLLDEPFSSIDEVLRRDLRDEIVRLQKRLGITVVFVTHSQQEALAISDRVAVLRAGRVIQYDAVEELYHRPRDQFVASFVGEANFLETDRGTIMLRPEQMELAERTSDGTEPTQLQRGAAPVRGAAEGDSSASDAAQNATTARAVVETHQFLGAHHRYQCDSDVGTLIVTSPQRYAVGTAVTVAYDPTQGCILPESESGGPQ
ncbi:MAG: ABC transporter ATP-binding protein [Alkalispirochaeta sp.]